MSGISFQRSSIDRRQNNMPVAVERRSGQDRRNDAVKAFEAIPMVRRTVSIPDSVNQGNIVPALGMASLALINLPEDCRDLRSAYKQLKGAEQSYNYTKFQHPFSFFRGTAIEGWVNKHRKNGNKVAKWLFDNDIALVDTAFGRKILKLTGSKLNDMSETSIKDFKGDNIHSFSYSGNWFAKLTARAMLRTTFLGVCVISLLQIPQILKSNNKIKQTVKSGVSVASITAGIGYGGALGAKFGGPAGSLIGMGAGAVLGNQISEKLV